jgi:Mlc titration factor MtfA (ptsG expression regulator)
MNPVARLRAWRNARTLRDHPLDEDAWRATIATLPLLGGLADDELARLRELATLFVHRKVFSGAHELEIDDAMRIAVAVQACLPVLELGEAWLDGWRSVIVYPESFVVDLEEPDEAGVVHAVRDERIGESWERGPLILSWADARPGVEPFGEGSNVVVHEIAHKLDQRDGHGNGCPPLHPGMNPAAWRRDFQAAYDALCREVDAGRTTWIDPYAAEAPDEFFAVLSEHFFTAPDAVLELVPAVYHQLRAFYRQDPLTRLGR